jgi:hypothetical protein
MERTSRALRFALAVVALDSGGCKGCRDDHPYVPYTIGETIGEQPANQADDSGAGSPSALTDDAGAFVAREATPAPPSASRMTVDGALLVAPTGSFFVAGLVADLDGDGKRDAAAIVQRADATSAGSDAAATDPGQLVFYRGQAGGLAPAEVIATPPALAGPAGCAPEHRLAQIGPHSLGVEMGTLCERTSGVRWVAALGINGDTPRIQFHATLLDPVNAPLLAVELDGSDRDGDGLDDIAVHVSIEGGAAPFEPGPRVSVVLRWFDRRAGMSRQPDEPEASFRALASFAAARAPKLREAPLVPRYVEEVRSLYRALCAEGGEPRVVDVDATRALSCGAGKGLEEAGLAEVRAYAVIGDPLRAIAALDRAQLPPATRTPQRTTDAQAWIAQSAPVLAGPSVLRAIGAVPEIERGTAPAWGALAFEPSGKVLIRTMAGVVRADPVQGDEAAADDVKPWRPEVVSPDGASRWLEAFDPCDGVSLRASFQPSGGGDVREVALPLPSPLGARCEPNKARAEPAPALPIAWGPRGLEAIVAGEPLLVAPDLTKAAPLNGSLDQPVTLGAPRSPNGKILVVPTSQGIYVRRTHSRLLRAKELEGGYFELRDCVASDDASRVACVRGGRAFVGVWGAEAD